MKKLLQKIHEILDMTKAIEFTAPLLLRLYLVPIFWMAGTKKWANFEGTVEWMGNADWGLGLPFPFLMAFLATWTEILGAIALLFGIGLRYISVPLMATMAVAAITVHWNYGWQAITDPGAPFANDRVMAAADKLAYAKEVLTEHADYSHLTSDGSIVMLNNGIEFAATYFIMLLALFFIGAGKYVSVDYWILRKLQK
jgi:uncharacterized membrane protein YphA (DoxX/SURF4 family)